MKIKAVIDEIEKGYYARILVSDEEIKVDWPIDLLPGGAKEGDILNFDIKIDIQETDKQREKATNLLEKLKNKNS